MTVRVIPATEAAARLADFSQVIDARSESEYAEDRLPGAVNWPSLNDEERALVGTIYKQVSPFEARKRGAGLVAANISRHIAREVVDKPREWQPPEIDLLVAIASQVAQTIEHAKLYAEAQRRVHELEALARISEAVSESLYLEESLEAIVKTTMSAVDATGAALVLEDADRPGVEQELGVRRAQAHTAGGVLAIDHDEVETPVAPQPRQQRADRRATGTPHHVAEEEEPHARGL